MNAPAYIVLISLILVLVYVFFKLFLRKRGGFLEVSASRHNFLEELEKSKSRITWNEFKGKKNTEEILEAKASKLAEGICQLAVLNAEYFKEVAVKLDPTLDALDIFDVGCELIILTTQYSMALGGLILLRTTGVDNGMGIFMGKLSKMTVQKIFKDFEKIFKQHVLLARFSSQHKKRVEFYSNLARKVMKIDISLLEAVMAEEYAKEVARLAGQENNKKLLKLAAVGATTFMLSLNIEGLLSE